MKFFLKILILTALVVSLFVFAKNDPGYAVLSRGEHAIEISLVGLIVFLAIVFAVLHILLRLYQRSCRLPGSLRQWGERRSEKRNMKAQEQGLRLLIEGDARRAQRLLSAYAESSPSAFINFAGAALAAHKGGHPEQRDEYLMKAREYLGADKAVAPTLLHARFLMEEGHPLRARDTLLSLDGGKGLHPEVLKMLAEIYEQSGEWHKLVELLPRLRRRSLLSMEELERLESAAWIGMLAEAEHEGEESHLTTAWKALPSLAHTRPAVVGKYASVLKEWGETDLALAVLEKALKKHWSSDLVRIYGSIRSEKPNRQFQLVESWLVSHEDDAELMLALGKLATNSQLWGQARSYLEMCISMDGPRQAYCELARLLEHQGEKDRALDYYRRGLELEQECPVSPWGRQNSQDRTWESATD